MSELTEIDIGKYSIVPIWDGTWKLQRAEKTNTGILWKDVFTYTSEIGATCVVFQTPDLAMKAIEHMKQARQIL